MSLALRSKAVLVSSNLCCLSTSADLRFAGARRDAEEDLDPLIALATASRRDDPATIRGMAPYPGSAAAIWERREGKAARTAAVQSGLRPQKGNGERRRRHPFLLALESCAASADGGGASDFFWERRAFCIVSANAGGEKIHEADCRPEE